MSIISLNATKRVSLYSFVVKQYHKLKYGKVPEPILAWSYAPYLMRPFIKLWQTFRSNKVSISKTLVSTIAYRTAYNNGCAYCQDIHASMLSKEQLVALNEFPNSNVFSKDIVAVLRYVDAICKDSKNISNDIIAELKNHYKENQVVEITALVAYQIMSTTFNNSLDLKPFGFCTIK